MTDWLAIVGAFGLGSLVTVIAQSLLGHAISARQRLYTERKEAYLGLLEAWVRQEDEGFTPASERNVGHWLLRAQLVASRHVLQDLKHWETTRPGSDERILATKSLKAAMRRDLA